MEQKISFQNRLPNMTSSLQRRFEKQMDGIEAALKDGWSHKEVVAHLNANGFVLKAGSFQTMLQRARRKRAAGRTESPHTVESAAATLTPDPPSPRPPRPAVKAPGLPATLVWDPHKEPNW